MINDLWYKNAIVYCLSVETFMDANGDGVGDFQGLMRRLDYLQGLGVTAIWLMPFQPSPQRDDGYDVSDYYGVDPRYGTLGDFVEFTHGCRAARHAGDHRSRRQPHLRPASLVPGGAQRPRTRPIATGTSGRQEARQRRPGHGFPGRAEDRPGPTMPRPRPGTSIASTSSSPTSNTANPEVQAEILKIMGFWIQLGVSGFRMDAVPFVIATKGAGGRRSPSSTTTCCATFREFLQWREGDAIILARGQRAARETTSTISATTATACT